MKYLNQYILEKFKISNNIKDKINTNTSESCIWSILNIPTSWNEFKDITKAIEDWCQDNELEEFIGKVNVYCPLRVLRKRNSGLYDRLNRDGWTDIIKEPDSKKANEISKILNEDKPIAKFLRSDKHGLLYRPNDTTLIYWLEYCETYFCFEVK